uniref:Uncharacterized protein n=1 Tax=Solanum lycopersicum TaxID=4081 RepID=A0A3Q7FKR1_SOLLC
MSSSNNKMVGKPCNKYSKNNSFPEIYGVNKRNVDFLDLSLKYDQNDDFFILERRSEKQEEKNSIEKILWIHKNPNSEHLENKNSTYCRPINKQLIFLTMLDHIRNWIF